MKTFCGLCPEESIGPAEFDAGNNAETRVYLELCQEHWDEMERDECAFQKKHYEKLDQLVVERSME